MLNKAEYTKQVYSWERELIHLQQLLTSPMDQLRVWTEKIWEEEGFEKPIPRIVAGRGVRYLNEYMSFS